MSLILVSFILLYVLQEGKELIKNRSWLEGLLGLVLIAVSLVYGIDYILEGSALPHLGTLLEELQPLANRFQAFFRLPT
jgi:hypothetical protein